MFLILFIVVLFALCINAIVFANVILADLHFS